MRTRRHSRARHSYPGVTNAPITSATAVSCACSCDAGSRVELRTTDVTSAGTTDSGAGRTIDLDQLQIQEQRLRSIVELAPACLARVARDGTILAMNNAARSMLGTTQARDVLKKSL